jgi:bifunctional enzyme CysN/CysC/sulfate adenylyltransferase subunit 1
VAFIPISAREGKNITRRAREMPWYEGATILEALDSFHNPPSNEESFFAMPLQDVYRFSGGGDERRIYAGTIVSGRIQTGEAVRFLPSNKEARVKTIEVWNAPPKTQARTNEASGFTLEEEIYVKRGEVMVKADEEPPVKAASRVKANVIWLGSRPLAFGKTYLLKLGGAQAEARLEKIENFLGDRENENPAELRRHDCGSVILGLSRPIAAARFSDNASLGRFVIVDGYDASGGGIVLECLADSQAAAKTDGGFEEELFALLRKYFPHRFA